MDTPFIYDKYVTGRNFIGRKKECAILGNLLGAGEHVVMYEPPKTGKMSLLQQTFINMRSEGRPFMVVNIEMFNVRTLESFLVKFGTAVMKAVYTTPDQYKDAIGKYLDGTHFIFDRDRFYQNGEVVSMNWVPEPEDLAKMLRLPHRIAAERGMPYYIILKEFQSVLSMDEADDVLAEMEVMFRERPEKPAASFIMLGSQVNAMKYIFAERKFFYRQVVHLPLQPIEEKDIVEHVVRGFLYGPGKSFERDLAMGACGLFKCNMWYINHLSAICDSMSKGFINEAIMVEALNSMIAIHEPRFINMVNDLTGFQLSLMRAVLDGVVRFSASEVIESYRLNSSANVRRVKDALKKKEIITFNEKDEPVILDPLFEYWLAKFYFER